LPCIDIYNDDKELDMSTEMVTRVTDLVIENLGVDASKVTVTSNFVDDLGADSLDTVELVMALEEEFGIEIPDDAAEKITNVQEAVAYITANAQA
tara:strand:- start:7244 stop:7528 length:285 start_codon:yes stop_codon:yes gene_type:complete